MMCRVLGKCPRKCRHFSLRCLQLGLLFGVLRMIVYRAKARMTAALAPGLRRPETAWTPIKAMLCSDVGIVPGPSAQTLTVRLLH